MKTNPQPTARRKSLNVDQVVSVLLTSPDPRPAVPSAASVRKTRRDAVSRALMGLLCGLLLVGVSGCNYFILLGYLIGGPPQLEPLFEKETKKSMTDRNVRVAVVCYAPNELKYQFDDIDHILAKFLAVQLSQKKIDVIPPDSVKLWLEQNKDWDTPDEVGEAFDTTYVIYVDISDFSLYERDSANLFRGRCEAIVSVYEMKADGTGKRIFQHDLTSAFPTQVPRSASEVSYESFRTEYFLRLSEEIGRMFYPYHHGDDISNAN